jgi:nucleotide-binding universal stress UspA family protein
MSPSPDVSTHCPPRTVLVGVDFGDASARALALAGVVASRASAPVVALHAERFEPPPYFTLEQIGRLETERRAAQDAAIAHLAQFAAAATAHPVEPLVVDAPAVDALLNQAATADLIVLGTHGRRGPGRWWLGSVAERVARAATVPVLVTRAADTPAPEVFQRLTIVGDGGGDTQARDCAQHLARLVGGHVTEGDRWHAAMPTRCGTPRWWSWPDRAAGRPGASPTESPRPSVPVITRCSSWPGSEGSVGRT